MEVDYAYRVHGELSYHKCTSLEKLHAQLDASNPLLFAMGMGITRCDS